MLLHYIILYHITDNKSIDNKIVVYIIYIYIYRWGGDPRNARREIEPRRVPAARFRDIVFVRPGA